MRRVRARRGGLLLCLGWGLRPAARTRLETVKNGSQACTQEGGKENGGGRVNLGKSEGGGEECVEKKIVKSVFGASFHIVLLHMS